MAKNYTNDELNDLVAEPGKVEGEFHSAAALSPVSFLPWPEEKYPSLLNFDGPMKTTNLFDENGRMIGSLTWIGEPVETVVAIDNFDLYTDYPHPEPLNDALIEMKAKGLTASQALEKMLGMFAHSDPIPYGS